MVDHKVDSNEAASQAVFAGLSWYSPRPSPYLRVRRPSLCVGTGSRHGEGRIDPGSDPVLRPGYAGTGRHVRCAVPGMPCYLATNSGVRRRGKASASVLSPWRTKTVPDRSFAAAIVRTMCTACLHMTAIALHALFINVGKPGRREIRGSSLLAPHMIGI